MASEFIHFGAQKFKPKDTWKMSQFCSKKVTQGKEYSGMLTHATDGSTKDEIRNPESGNGKRNRNGIRNQISMVKN